MRGKEPLLGKSATRKPVNSTAPRHSPGPPKRPKGDGRANCPITIVSPPVSPFPRALLTRCGSSLMMIWRRVVIRRTVRAW